MTLFSIYYSTPFNVPAPFSYEVSVAFSTIEDQFHVDFQMEYNNREDMLEEEVLNEGFTLNDDFSWKGNLDKIWQIELENLLTKTEKRNSTKDQEIIIRQSVEKEYSPRNYKEWNVMLQDVIQAIFETSGKEQPWQLELEIHKKGEKKLQLMKVLFAKREVDFAYGSKIKMDWNQSKKFMGLIYLGEFDETKASTQKPDNEGVYLCFDQLTWYKLGHSITNPHGNMSYLEKLDFELEGLV